MEALLETHSGRVRGRREGADLCVFRGIPYAASSHGERRWRPPGAPSPWAGARDATRGGPDAPQFGEGPFFDAERRYQNEDCLVLNVWTPELDAGGRPVMVFIHGGAFATGGGVRELYDGRFLAVEADVVVVTLNYRLGVLGLLASPQLRDAESGAAANWCMLDQIAALEWVRDHARAIGGDPNRVTIFGESAGGASVGLLAVSPLARGLFQRVIVQSGAPIPIPIEQADRAAASFCRELGIDEGQIESLRGAPLESLRAAYPSWQQFATHRGFALRPCMDGVFLPESPLDLIDAGATRGLEIAVGTNRDELALMPELDPAYRNIDARELSKRVAALLDSEEAAAELLQRYREMHRKMGLSREPGELYTAIGTSYFIRNGSYAYLERHVAKGGKGYAYLFDWESPKQKLGACHGLELPFCFGTLESAAGAREFAGEGPRATALRDRMLHAWADFAHGNAAAAFGPTFDAERRSTMRFGPECGPADSPLNEERDAWGGITPDGGGGKLGRMPEHH